MWRRLDSQMHVFNENDGFGPSNPKFFLASRGEQGAAWVLSAACRPMQNLKFLSDPPPKLTAIPLSGRPYSALYRRSLVVPRLPFLNTCSDDSKPYMILKALDEDSKNHIGFAIIQAIGEKK